MLSDAIKRGGLLPKKGGFSGWRKDSVITQSPNSGHFLGGEVRLGKMVGVLPSSRGGKVNEKVLGKKNPRVVVRRLSVCRAAGKCRTKVLRDGEKSRGGWGARSLRAKAASPRERENKIVVRRGKGKGAISRSTGAKGRGGTGGLNRQGGCNLGGPSKGHPQKGASAIHRRERIRQPLSKNPFRVKKTGVGKKSSLGKGKESSIESYNWKAKTNKTSKKWVET